MRASVNWKAQHQRSHILEGRSRWGPGRGQGRGGRGPDWKRSRLAKYDIIISEPMNQR